MSQNVKTLTLKMYDESSLGIERRKGVLICFNEKKGHGASELVAFELGLWEESCFAREALPGKERGMG